MIHPKMRYTYVGIDSHKDTHTAVFMDCFFEKLGEIVFENLPSKFEVFLNDALKFQADGTVLLFGLEDVSAYGRNLAVFLKNNSQYVKHVNSLLVAMERKNRNIIQKTDSVDAECAARVLLSKFGELADSNPLDKYWILRSIVKRRDYICKNNASLKNHLYCLMTPHYPNYRKFFKNIGCKSSLEFLMRYPSPKTLKNTTAEELTELFYKATNGTIGAKKAIQILNEVEDTAVEFQEIRDEAVQSTVRQIKFNMTELDKLEETLSRTLAQFGTTLTTMTGIETVTAARLLSYIGDIKRFSTPAKLARYSGVAPVTYASGKKDLQFANQRGNRELNSLFYNLAVRVSMTVGPTNKVMNSFFYEYYHRKISEGKTKHQAIKCVQRRLVNIIWAMLTRNQEYTNPPMYSVPKKNPEKKPKEKLKEKSKEKPEKEKSKDKSNP